MKIFLSIIFAFVVSLFLHAEETENGLTNFYKSDVADKEYIYIVKNTRIYGKHLLFDRLKASSKSLKKSTVIKKEDKTPAKVEKETSCSKPASAIFPVLPFEPSKSSFSQGGNEPATISYKQRIGGNVQPGKNGQENIYPFIKNIFFLHHPEQRQKLSISATQCGVLTSFSSQSPPALS